MDIEAWKKAAEHVYDFGDGERTIRFRALSRVDLPKEAWPLLQKAHAFVMASRKNGDGQRTDDEDADLDKLLAEIDSVADRDDAQDIVVTIITRACLEPHVWDHRKGDTPPGAIPLYAIEPLHQDLLVSRIIDASCGLGPIDQEEEAKRMSRFRDESGDEAGDAGGETDVDTSVGAA